LKKLSQKSVYKNLTDEVRRLLSTDIKSKTKGRYLLAEVGFLKINPSKLAN